MVSGDTEFQFTHPVRGATNLSNQLEAEAQFQFTHPVRGATCEVYQCLLGRRRFNSRTPCGVRRREPIQPPRSSASFNSRTPCGVRPRRARGSSNVRRVSIHAPRAGCDICTGPLLLIEISFNSRTPCGVRRRVTAPRSRVRSFNSRTPCGVRRELRTSTAQGSVSIHAPRAGCDGRGREY